MSIACHTCVYNNCKNTKKNNSRLHFFKIPNERGRAQIWLNNIGNLKLMHLASNQLRNRLVCEEHFTDDSFCNIIRDRLVKNAVPIHFSMNATAPSSARRKYFPYGDTKTVCQSKNSSKISYPRVINKKRGTSASIRNENKLTVGKFEEVVINEAVTNGSVEATLQSTIKTERHDLDFDPFPSTSSSETTSQFAPDPEIVIKQETYDEDMVNSSFTKETNFDTEESGASPDHSVEILKFAESVKKQFENDPDWLFCLSLLPHLKRMLKIQRDNAKLNILDVIEKYKTL